MLPAAALVFDVLDGLRRAAPSRSGSRCSARLELASPTSSRLGVAPAVLGYTPGCAACGTRCCCRSSVCCGISRLARFNVTAASLTNADTGKVRYFEGLPIPTSVLLVFTMALLFQLERTGDGFPGGAMRLLGREFHPFALLFLASGSLMISTIKVPKP